MAGSFKILGHVMAGLTIILLLMEEILHQVIGCLSHYLEGFCIPGGCLGFLPSTEFLSSVDGSKTIRLTS